MGVKKIVWFSCGAASAVTAMLAVKKYPDAVIAYCDTGSEHPDNARFLTDVSKWINKEVTILKSPKFKDIWEVFEARRYIVGTAGAPCTALLKRDLRNIFTKDGDIQIFGFTAEEKKRAVRFSYNNPAVNLETPLIDEGITKRDCLAMIAKAGIEIPTMYKLGYKNNNCIGCVKGGSGYWNKIRIDFPNIFKRMAKLERRLNAAICKRYEGKKRFRVFLDELPPNAGNYETEPDISCGIICSIAYEKIAP